MIASLSKELNKSCTFFQLKQHQQKNESNNIVKWNLSDSSQVKTNNLRMLLKVTIAELIVLRHLDISKADVKPSFAENLGYVK